MPLDSIDLLTLQGDAGDTRVQVRAEDGRDHDVLRGVDHARRSRQTGASRRTRRAGCVRRTRVRGARRHRAPRLRRVGAELLLTTPKAEKKRTVVVANLVAVELRRHVRDHQADGLMFRSVRGAPMLKRDQSYDSARKPALRGAGLAEDRFVFHTLRHSARRACWPGAPLTAVARAPGQCRRDGVARVPALVARRP